MGVCCAGEEPQAKTVFIKPVKKKIRLHIDSDNEERIIGKQKCI